MNEAIERLIDWCATYGWGVDLWMHGSMGSIWLTVTLSYGTKKLSHCFYIPGGVLCVDNWRRGQCDVELDHFLEEANEMKLRGEFDLKLIEGEGDNR